MQLCARVCHIFFFLVAAHEEIIFQHTKSNCHSMCTCSVLFVIISAPLSSSPLSLQSPSSPSHLKVPSLSLVNLLSLSPPSQSSSSPSHLKVPSLSRSSTWPKCSSKNGEGGVKCKREEKEVGFEGVHHSYPDYTSCRNSFLML